MKDASHNEYHRKKILFLPAVASAVTSVAFQISLVIWPDALKPYGSVAKYLWGLAILLWLLVITNWVREKRAQAHQTASTSSTNTVVSIPSSAAAIQINPTFNLTQTASPTISPNAATAVKPSPQPRRHEVQQEPRPNLIFVRASNTSLFCNQNEGIFLEANGSGNLQGITATFRNEPEDKRIADADYVKAQVTYLDKSGQEVWNISNACWLDNYWETFDFAAGEDGTVLLVLAGPATFGAPYKKREPSGSSMGGDVVNMYTRALGPDIATIRLRLIGESNTVLKACRFAIAGLGETAKAILLP